MRRRKEYVNAGNCPLRHRKEGNSRRVNHHSLILALIICPSKNSRDKKIQEMTAFILLRKSQQLLPLSGTLFATTSIYQDLQLGPIIANAGTPGNRLSLSRSRPPWTVGWCSRIFRSRPLPSWRPHIHHPRPGGSRLRGRLQRESLAQEPALFCQCTHKQTLQPANTTNTSGAETNRFTAGPTRINNLPSLHMQRTVATTTPWGGGQGLHGKGHHSG